MMVIALMPTVVSAIIHSNYSTLKELLYSIPAFLLIHGWIPDIKYTYAGNSVSWFLSSMLFCYVMAPFIIRMALKYLKKMILLFVLILAIYFIIILYIPTNRIGYYACIFPLSRLLDFSIGVLLFPLMYIFPYNCNQTNNISTTRKTILTILEALSFLLVWIAMIFSAIVPPQYERASLYWIPSISIILVFATFGPRGGYISEVLNKKWMSSMGAYSFPIYMIHFIAIRYYRPLIAHLGFEPNNLVWISLGTVIMTLLAYAYVNKVEPVIQRVLV